MENEFKIRIITDSKGNKISLENITIEAADSLKIFIDSLASFASSYKDSSEFKISLKEGDEEDISDGVGSLESILVFPKNDSKVAEDINAVLNGRSKDKNKIKELKKIQDRIKENGLAYDVSWRVNDIDEDLTSVFKGKKFIYKRERQEYFTEIVFLEGRLIKIGGEPNTYLYIEVNQEQIRVQCTAQQAINIRKPVYDEIFISSRKTNTKRYPPSYELIDYYRDTNDQREIEELYRKINSTKTLDKFDILHDKIYTLVQKDKIAALIHIINLFNNNDTERGIIRTLLISLKPIIKNESFYQIRPLYNSLSETFRIGSANKSI